MRIPETPQLLQLVDHGLAKMGTELSFMLSSSPARILVWIRELLPRLFQYLSIENPWVLDITDDDDEELATHKPILLLLSPRRGKLTVATPNHPDGTSCHQCKGRDSAGWKESAVWLGKCLLLSYVPSHSSSSMAP